MFYCHFPDKLLADGELRPDGDGKIGRRRKGGMLKRVYRMPMDWLEEITTGEFYPFFSKITVSCTK